MNKSLKQTRVILIGGSSHVGKSTLALDFNDRGTCKQMYGIDIGKPLGFRVFLDLIRKSQTSSGVTNI